MSILRRGRNRQEGGRSNSGLLEGSDPAKSKVVVEVKKSLAAGIELISVAGKNLGDENIPKIAEELEGNKTCKWLQLASNGLTATSAQVLAKALEVNKSLQSLDLNRNSIGNDGALKIALALSINVGLIILELHSNNIGDAGASAFAKALEKNTLLRSLGLSGNRIGDNGASELGRCLHGRNNSLRELHLGSNQVGNAGASEIAAALMVNKVLDTLRLERNPPLTDEGVMAIASAIDANNTLKELWLVESTVTNQAVERIASALEGNTSLTKFAFTATQAQSVQTLASNVEAVAAVKRTQAVRMAIIHVQNGKERLVLTGAAMGENGTFKLAEAVKASESLKDVRFRRCDMTNKCFAILLEALCTKTMLRQLVISDANLGDHQCSILAARVIAQNPGLTYLSLEACRLPYIVMEKIAGAIHRNAALTKVCLNDNRLADDSARSLAQAIGMQSTLQELSLDRCFLSAKAMAYIANSLSSGAANLQCVSLAGNNLSASAAQAFSQALPSSKSLIVLDMSDCSLDSPSCVKLAQAIRLCQTLRKLCLSGNVIDGEACKGIASMLQSSKLRELILERCSIGDEGVALLAEAAGNSPALDKVLLGGNEVSDKAKGQFSSARRLTFTLQDVIKRPEAAPAVHTQVVAVQTKGLDRIAVDGCVLEWKDITEVSTLLEEPSGLKKLYLTNVQLTDQCAARLAAAIERTTTLRDFSLCKSNLSDVGAARMTKAVLKNHGVQSWKVEGNGRNVAKLRAVPQPKEVVGNISAQPKSGGWIFGKKADYGRLQDEDEMPDVPDDLGDGRALGVGSYAGLDDMVPNDDAAYRPGSSRRMGAADVPDNLDVPDDGVSVSSSPAGPGPGTARSRLTPGGELRYDQVPDSMRMPDDEEEDDGYYDPHSRNRLANAADQAQGRLRFDQVPDRIDLQMPGGEDASPWSSPRQSPYPSEAGKRSGRGHRLGGHEQDANKLKFDEVPDFDVPHDVGEDDASDLSSLASSHRSPRAGGAARQRLGTGARHGTGAYDPYARSRLTGPTGREDSLTYDQVPDRVDVLEETANSDDEDSARLGSKSSAGSGGSIRARRRPLSKERRPDLGYQEVPDELPILAEGPDAQLDIDDERDYQMEDNVDDDLPVEEISAHSSAFQKGKRGTPKRTRVPKAQAGPSNFKEGDSVVL
mmetsp:Transcript_15614/g.36548  ORF Transcript_15614/g.36548 Transcript_15614/m.36548 type:complete len:1165 (-) Transcript_15614:89-3583(-)